MKTSWAYPASRQTKRVKGKRKGKTHRVVAALMSNHLNQVHAWSTKTKEWNKAHSHLCLQKEKGSIPNWFALYAVTRENGEPRTDTRCLTKTRSKNRQTTVRQFVSYTIYSRSGGDFFFFPVKHRNSHRKYTCCCHDALFSLKKGQQKANHSHTHIYLVQNLVIFHLGSFLQL